MKKVITKRSKEKKSRHYLTLIEGSRSLLCIVPPSHLEDQEALLITHP